LVPFKLLRRIAFHIEEIVNPSILSVPSLIQCSQGYLNGSPDEIRIAPSLCEIHHEPHCLDCMPGVKQPPFEAVREGTVRRNVLQDESVLLTEKYIHHLMDALLFCSFNHLPVNQMRYQP